MVRNYQNADCSLRKNFIVSFIIIFGTLSFPMSLTLFPFAARPGCCCCFLFFNDFYRTNYVNVSLTYRCQMFRLDRTIAVDDQSKISFSIRHLSICISIVIFTHRVWLGSRVVSVLDSGTEGPRFKSQPRRCRVTVLGKLFTPIVPLFTKQQNW